MYYKYQGIIITRYNFIFLGTIIFGVKILRPKKLFVQILNKVYLRQYF